jgi:hypothetical protein
MVLLDYYLVTCPNGVPHLLQMYAFCVILTYWGTPFDHILEGVHHPDGGPVDTPEDHPHEGVYPRIRGIPPSGMVCRRPPGWCCGCTWDGV